MSSEQNGLSNNLNSSLDTEMEVVIDEAAFKKARVEVRAQHKFSSGSTYEGEWKLNTRHGFGK